MGLNIIVCVKSTPTTSNISLDSAGQIKSSGLVYAMNPYDEYAVEEAVKIKEKNPDSTVTALTAGGPASESILRDAIARGCDQGAIALTPEIDNANPLATSLLLSAAIKKLHSQKPVHLLLFGKNTNDVNSGSVGSATAARLDWPSVISVKKIDSIDENSATVWRVMEDGIDVLKVSLPAAIGTVKEINEPRLASLKGKMAAKKAELSKWTPADLGLKPEEIANALASASAAKFEMPPSRPAGLKIEGASAAEKAKKLVDVLFERKLI